MPARCRLLQNTLLPLIAAALVSPLSGLRAQNTPPATRATTRGPAIIELRGENNTSQTFGAADFARLRRHEVVARDHGGRENRFSGVSLAEVMRLVGAPRSDSIRGRALALYVLVEAADGYRAVYSLAELDSAYTDRVVLLADRADGALLGDDVGPYRIVVPGEKRQSRWVRQVRSISLRRAPE